MQAIRLMSEADRQSLRVTDSSFDYIMWDVAIVTWKQQVFRGRGM